MVIDSTGSLTIYALSVENRGSYICEVNNGIGQIKQHFQVDVHGTALPGTAETTMRTVDSKLCFRTTSFAERFHGNGSRCQYIELDSPSLSYPWSSVANDCLVSTGPCNQL